jgi:hypothetical protein
VRTSDGTVRAQRAGVRGTLYEQGVIRARSQAEELERLQNEPERGGACGTALARLVRVIVPCSFESSSRRTRLDCRTCRSRACERATSLTHRQAIVASAVSIRARLAARLVSHHSNCRRTVARLVGHLGARGRPLTMSSNAIEVSCSRWGQATARRYSRMYTYGAFRRQRAECYDQPHESIAERNSEPCSTFAIASAGGAPSDAMSRVALRIPQRGALYNSIRYRRRRAEPFARLFAAGDSEQRPDDTFKLVHAAPCSCSERSETVGR